MSTPVWTLRGSLRGPAGPRGPSVEVLPFSMQGQVRVASGVGRFPIKDGSYSLLSVAAAVEGAPVGAPIVADVKVNGVSVYATHPERRPTVPDGKYMATVGEHDATVLKDGDYENVDVLVVGSVLPGRFLVVVVRLEQIVAVTDG